MKKSFVFLLLLSAFVFGLDIPKEFGKVRRLDYKVIFYKSKIVEIRYPQFLDKEYDDLNGILENTVNSMWSSWKDDLLDNIKSGFRTSYYLGFSIKRFDDRVVSIVFEDYAYTGGAHGMPTRRVVNYDMKDEKLLKLSDLFEEGVDWKSQINRFVKEYFKRVPTLNKFESINDDQSFYITTWGIVIFFAPYEYTPYAAGFPEIPISFSSLKGVKDEYRR